MYETTKNEAQIKNVYVIGLNDSASNITRSSRSTTSTIKSLRAREASKNAGLIAKAKALNEKHLHDNEIRKLSDRIARMQYKMNSLHWKLK